MTLAAWLRVPARGGWKWADASFREHLGVELMEVWVVDSVTEVIEVTVEL